MTLIQQVTSPPRRLQYCAVGFRKFCSPLCATGFHLRAGSPLPKVLFTTSRLLVCSIVRVLNLHCCCLLYATASRLQPSERFPGEASPTCDRRFRYGEMASPNHCYCRSFRCFLLWEAVYLPSSSVAVSVSVSAFLMSK